MQKGKSLLDSLRFDDELSIESGHDGRHSAIAWSPLAWGTGEDGERDLRFESVFLVRVSSSRNSAGSVVLLLTTRSDTSTLRATLELLLRYFTVELRTHWNGSFCSL